jgi:general stress protein 26
MKLSEIYEFVKTCNLAVVSTINQNGSPQSAVVEFAEQPDLTIIIHTLNTSRKYQNLRLNKEVAIVIGWDNNITVQINAVAHELAGDELAIIKQIYSAKNERAKKWEIRPDIAYFAFKPTWIRYSDLGQKPWIIQEFNIKT